MLWGLFKTDGLARWSEAARPPTPTTTSCHCENARRCFLFTRSCPLPTIGNRGIHHARLHKRFAFVQEAKSPPVFAVVFILAFFVTIIERSRRRQARAVLRIARRHSASHNRRDAASVKRVVARLKVQDGRN